MIFIWKGKGAFVLVAIIVNFILTALIGPSLGFKDGTTQIVALELIIAILLSIPIWIYGRKWNSEKRELIDKLTGKELIITNQHSFFWIPMQYWAIIYPVIILLVMIFHKG